MSNDISYDSILLSVKKVLGIDPEYDYFDPDLILQINSVFSILNQIGVGPLSGFAITDETDEWSDFSSDLRIIGIVKSYVPLKIRILFDPPSNSFMIDALTKQIAEYESRLSYYVDPEDTFG